MSDSATVKLDGRRVLVVEDEALVSMLLEDMLDDLGCRVLGPMMRVREALAFVAKSVAEVDVAILDVNVAGELSFPIAEALDAHGVPFVLATGYDDAGIEERWRSRPVLRKPFLASQLEAVLKQALGAAS
jgi:CheY-like chemotaxis protein